MAVEHYENFPVASILIPKKQRFAIQTIYHFARTADDIADENLEIKTKIKQQQLNVFKKFLDVIQYSISNNFGNDFSNDILEEIQNNIRKSITNENFEIFYNFDKYKNITNIFTNLAEVITKFKLNLQHFHDLLMAFQQDLVKRKYNDFGELKNYCSNSANPVGRLVLSLFDINDKQSFYHSDCICSALQLINFCQDFFIDIKQKQRLYIPLNEVKKHNLTYNYFLQTESQQILNNNNWKNLMLVQCNRAKNLMLEGVPLLKKLSGRLKWEIKFTIAGGLFIIEKIISNLENDNINLTPENYRPTISKKDFFTIAKKAFVL